MKFNAHSNFRNCNFVQMNMIECFHLYLMSSSWAPFGFEPLVLSCVVCINLRIYQVAVIQNSGPLFCLVIELECYLIQFNYFTTFTMYFD